MEKSFFRKLIEEKGLYSESIQVEYDNLTFCMSVANILTYIEQATEKEREEIKQIMSKINFFNTDLLHYLKYLALSYIKENYSDLKQQQIS